MTGRQVIGNISYTSASINNDFAEVRRIQLVIKRKSLDVSTSQFLRTDDEYPQSRMVDAGSWVYR